MAMWHGQGLPAISVLSTMLCDVIYPGIVSGVCVPEFSSYPKGEIAYIGSYGLHSDMLERNLGTASSLLGAFVS